VEASLLAPAVGCADDADLCGEGKKFFSNFFCYRSDTAHEARQKCPALCGTC
jgi:hypothetical protein